MIVLRMPDCFIPWLGKEYAVFRRNSGNSNSLLPLGRKVNSSKRSFGNQSCFGIGRRGLFFGTIAMQARDHDVGDCSRDFETSVASGMGQCCKPDTSKWSEQVGNRYLQAILLPG